MDSPPASYFEHLYLGPPRRPLRRRTQDPELSTPSGEFHVWTKRVGNNPLKVLLLHGGPGSSDEAYECFDAWFPRAGVEHDDYNHSTFATSQTTRRSGTSG